MAMTPNAATREIRTLLTTELRAWEEAAETDSHKHISDLSWIVACSGGLALNITGDVWTPIFVKPGFVGVTVLLRADAERVAARRGDSYKAVLMRDYPAQRISDLRELLAFIPE